MGQSKDHFDFLGVREAIVLMLERDADVALGPVVTMLIGCGAVAVVDNWCVGNGGVMNDWWDKKGDGGGRLRVTRGMWGWLFSRRYAGSGETVTVAGEVTGAKLGNRGGDSCRGKGMWTPGLPGLKERRRPRVESRP